MKLSELNTSAVERAVQVYLELAYGKGRGQRTAPDLSLPADAEPEQVLGLFQRDDTAGGKSGCVRYSMRLGNRNYPFMKLLLQEHIVAGEFFFAVDTHDEMDIKPDYPDYDAWMAVRRFNLGLKQGIEAGFAAAGLPTASTLRELVCSRSGTGDGGATGTILVVDDEQDLALAVEALLSARGYTIHTAYDGANGVALAERLRPDLVILDYELPEMDGLEVIAALRDNRTTRRIPVLLCTASRIGVGDIRKADGFLAKPYQEELLYEMVQRVISTRRDD